MPFNLGLMELIPVLLVLSALALVPFAMYQCLVRESPEGNTKVAWLLAILLAPGFGAIFYLFFRRPARIRELGR